MIKHFSFYTFLKYTGFAVTLLLTGCSDSNPTHVPTDTSLVFSIFPETYFSGSYSTSYSLNGYFSNGNIATAFLGIQSGSTTVFNAQPIKAIDSIFSLTNVTNGVLFSAINETYYSTDINNLTIEGGYRTIDAVSSMPISTNTIPLTGTIGDFGLIGNYTLSDGSNTISTWAILDGLNGKAKFVITSVNSASSNTLLTTSTESWTISQDGTRSFINIQNTYHQSGDLTLILSGSKI